MLFRSIKLYFAKRKLKKCYDTVQTLAGEKLTLRKKIQEAQTDITNQLDVLKNKFNIEDPKEYLR